MCNMIGAVLTNQEPIQQIIGIYYIVQDLVLWGQYFYYTNVYPKKHQRSGSSCLVFVQIYQNFLVEYSKNREMAIQT